MLSAECSVVSFSQLDLAAKHAVDEYEVGDRYHCAEGPPNQADGQSVSARGSVIDGETVFGIAGREYDGIERKRRTHQHRSDVQTGADKSELLFALGIRPEHDAKAKDNGNRNQQTDLVTTVVLHDSGPNEVRRDQGAECQKKLQRPEEQSKAASATA